jgi:bifunctional DNase/RNase
MSKDIFQVSVRAVIPTNGASAVFLTDGDKSIVIHMDPSVGVAISMFMRGIPKERPLTHDLIGLILTAFGARVDRVVINDIKSSTFYARLILSAENELHQRKIMEIDARPSDCIALATAHQSPIYITREVWDEAEDMSEALRQMEESAGEEPGED